MKASFYVLSLAILLSGCYKEQAVPVAVDAVDAGELKTAITADTWVRATLAATDIVAINTAFRTFTVKAASLYNHVIDEAYYYRIAGKTSETTNFRNKFIKFYEEASKALGNPIGVKMFTQQQIDDYVKLATKNSKSNKVLLGNYDNVNRSASYDVIAKNKGYTYFDMENKWDEAKSIVDGSREQIWRINKQFLDEQYLVGKEFWFSHNPYSPETIQYFSDEVLYLIDLGVKDFEKTGDLWRAIW
ncbi:hypothetical protein FACS189430_12590 [Bacteroidia bacterium]|nr:hypothetical protein FACS189430_12590 [Bacteroidia bacterium]